jgi:hypothetical protein
VQHSVRRRKAHFAASVGSARLVVHLTV